MSQPQQCDAGHSLTGRAQLPGVHVYHVQQPCPSTEGPYRVLQDRLGYKNNTGACISVCVLVSVSVSIVFGPVSFCLCLFVAVFAYESDQHHSSVVVQLDVVISLRRRVVVARCCVASLLCVLDASLPLHNWDRLTRGSSVVNAPAS